MPTDADHTADYKSFTIRIFKTPNGCWRAIITKADGSKIKAAGQNESFDLIPVQLESLERDKAFKEVKRLIDARRHDLTIVRFAPESGHLRCTSQCLLWANSGHRRQQRRSRRLLKR